MSKDKQDLKKKEVIQAVIIDDLLCSDLCAKGSKTPKSLLPVANIPVLDYALSCLSAVGVEETLLYIAAKSPVLEQHLKLSNWNEPGTMHVKVVVCEGCQTFGDLMRELDSSNAIQGDFFLLYADTICTAQLKPILDLHKATALKDKNAVITMVFSQTLPGHASRCEDSELVLGLDNSRVISQQRIQPSESILPVPVELLQSHANIELRYDLLDPCISICSLTVPPIFSDNFDFQTRDDFVKGLLLNEDILGHTMYAHILDNAYAARSSSLSTYLASSLDVLKRWTFPLTPDASFSLVDGSYFYDIMGNCCKQANVKIGRSKVSDCVLASGTKIGNNCDIRMSVIGKNCSIGDNVKLSNTIIWDSSSIESGFSGSNILIHANSKIKKAGSNQAVKLAEEPSKDKQKNRFQEFYESETDSSDDEIGGNVQVDEYETFFNEVQDSLSRGFKERLDTEDLKVEINSSRFANDIPAGEVSFWVTKVIFGMPSCVEDTIEKVLKYFKPILARYVTNAKTDQVNCISAMEQVADSLGNYADCAKVLGYLYNSEILEEDSIVSWFNEDAGEGIKGQKNMQTFINWLQTADEESDESD